MSRKGKAGRIVTLVFAGAVLLAALYIMVNGLGLSPDYDFGAGAYYYADIPSGEQVPDASVRTSVPLWVYILLFLGWGALMYWLWKKMDKK